MVVELAAGALAAEEIVSTAVYTGVAAYAITKATLPLKATFSQIATTSVDDGQLSLNRSHHSLTVVKDKAYIFGGRTEAGLAGSEIHAISLLSLAEAEEKAASQYAVIPPVAAAQANDEKRRGSEVPSRRYGHAACSLNMCVAVFGGLGEDDKLADADGCLWLFNIDTHVWECITTLPAPAARANATLCPHGNGFVLYGGSAEGKNLSDVWHFDYPSSTWTELTTAPVASAKAVVCTGTLYLLSFPDRLGAELYSLPLQTPISQEAQWTTQSLPTNPLVSSLAPREGAIALGISFSHGRNFLLYMLGRDRADAWTIQLPAADAAVTAPKQSGAAIKDSIRTFVGASTGKLDMAEVEINLPKALDSAPAGTSGKLHPGPRSWAAADVMKDGNTVIVWGGTSRLDGKDNENSNEGDGWMIRWE